MAGLLFHDLHLYMNANPLSISMSKSKKPMYKTIVPVFPIRPVPIFFSSLWLTSFKHRPEMKVDASHRYRKSSKQNHAQKQEDTQNLNKSFYRTMRSKLRVHET
ncbi:uncharacterized protein AKAW2_40478A [Aspergillus luchuensis]|uniref:Uncharacterized protein n=1 Tax=Aspergillus kawachii TaxID=1069201 RepID=A0A7R7ZY55_ASPKA|nr:uncharacterized protein AKAW2_40478A [Aspergillus luchuensis]BCR98795.1 hypothetical protein AKAW2_40478A [Aspergillus luchuensis]